MAVKFSSISAIEILDSRGRPTLSVWATLSDRRQVRSGVPSGGRPAAGRQWSCATMMNATEAWVCSKRWPASTGRSLRR